MPDFFMLSNPANPYSTRLSDDSPIYNTHLICRRAKIKKAAKAAFFIYCWLLLSSRLARSEKSRILLVGGALGVTGFRALAGLRRSGRAVLQP